MMRFNLNGNERPFCHMICLFIIACWVVWGCQGGGDGNGGNDNDEQNNTGTLSAPSGLQAVVVDEDAIRVDWSDNSDGETGFEIQQSDDGVNFDVSYTVGGNTTTYTIEGLTENVDYSFRVRAYDDTGNSEFSSIVVIALGPLLDQDYYGTLTLHFTNTSLPPIDETASVDAFLSRYGALTFGTGTLSYDEVEEQDGFKIQRTGSMFIDPDGWYNDAGTGAVIEVLENTTIQETVQSWIRDNSSNWIQVANESFTETWNGGLVFDFQEAQLGQATVSVTTETGSVVWTLGLIPGAP